MDLNRTDSSSQAATVVNKCVIHSYLSPSIPVGSVVNSSHWTVSQVLWALVTTGRQPAAPLSQSGTCCLPRTQTESCPGKIQLHSRSSEIQSMTHTAVTKETEVFSRKSFGSRDDTGPQSGHASYLAPRVPEGKVGPSPSPAL